MKVINVKLNRIAFKYDVQIDLKFNRNLTNIELISFNKDFSIEIFSNKKLLPVTTKYEVYIYGKV